MGLEDQLQVFFNSVGKTDYLNLYINAKQYYGLMKKYPEIVKKNIKRFLIYFDYPMTHASVLEIIEEIARDIPEAREEIVKELGPIFYEWAPLWENKSQGKHLKKILEYIDLPLSKIDEEINRLVRSIVTLKRPIVLIIGAGFSYDTMPITTELHPLLIRILRDNDIKSPVKMIEKNEKEAWKIISKNEVLFKERFVGWCAKTKIAPQHKIVAKMLYEGKISHIISFNWDDLIERAYRKMYRKPIPKINIDGVTPKKSSLWKLHGDVEDISKKWTFPFEHGKIFNSLIESLNKSVENDSPEFALIVGYSEWEKVVRDNLINWLENNFPKILRIRPNVKEKEGNIPETAKSFFQRLNIYIMEQEKSNAD